MTFEIFDKDKQRIFHTTTACAISSIDELTALRRKGCKFKIDGQLVPISAIKKWKA